MTVGRFDLLDMDDDEREELAKQPAPPPAPSPLASRAPGMSYAAAGAALHGMLADRFRDVDDDGNDPETADTYVFAASLEETEGRVIVAITPGDSVDSSRGQGAESFEYWSPRQMPSVDAVLHAGKGTTTSGNKVSAWLDQSANAVSFTQSTDAERPELVPNAIGSMPVLRYTKGQSLGLASPRVSSTGLTYYIVARYTSTDTTKTDSRDVPLTVIGNSTSSGTNAAGFSGSSLAYTNIVSGTPTTYTKVTSPALNDGQVWLSGWNHATGTGSGNLRPYVGSDLGDTAQAGNVPYDTTNNGYDRIGVGHDPTDGFEGDLAAVIITRATPNLVNRQKLHKWAMQQFGVSDYNYTT